MRNLKKVYIAGPEVFREDAKKVGEHYKSICSQYGFTGIYPLDSGYATAKEIFEWDVRAIKDCDIVVANLNPFRGHNIDEGTAFEIGVAFSLCKKIYGYMSDIRSLTERYGKKDTNGYYYEGFDLPVNLMIARAAIIIEGDFETCVRVMSGKKRIP